MQLFESIWVFVLSVAMAIVEFASLSLLAIDIFTSMVEMMESNYPENLKHVFVINGQYSSSVSIFWYSVT